MSCCRGWVTALVLIAAPAGAISQELEAGPNEVTLQTYSGDSRSLYLTSEIEIETPFGTLRVPPDQVMELRCMRRLTKAEKEHLQKLTLQLAGENPERIQRIFQAFRDRACPETLELLVNAAGVADEVAAERASQLHAELLTMIPRLDWPDVVVTPLMTIAGSVQNTEIQCEDDLGLPASFSVGNVKILSTGLLGMPRVTLPLNEVRGPLWKVANEEQPGWKQVGFDDAGWSRALGFDGASDILVWDRRPVTEWRSLYARRCFYLPQLPVDAVLTVWSASGLESGEVFVNGKAMKAEATRSPNNVQIPLSGLREGPNVIAMSWSYQFGVQTTLTMK